MSVVIENDFQDTPCTDLAPLTPEQMKDPEAILERIREADGVPMTRELAWYDLTLAPAMAEWDGGGSAYERLKQLCGVTLGGAEQTVEAVLSSDAESAAFGFEQPQPCLLFKRMTRVITGALVEYVEGTFRGDAYVYRIELQP